MSAQHSIDETQPGSRVDAPLGLHFPVVVNIVLLIVTTTIIAGGVLYYQRASRMAVAFENRFITTEWRLLSQLKAETDRRLEAKDREIAFLRQQYQTLLDGGGSVAERAEVNRAIERAYAEREDILAKRISAPMILADRDRQTEGKGALPGASQLVPEEESGSTGVTGTSGTSVGSVAEPSASLVFPELFSQTDSQALMWYRRGIDDLLGIGDGDVLVRVDADSDVSSIPNVSVADHDRLRGLAGFDAQMDLLRSEAASLRSREVELAGTIQQLREALRERDNQIVELRTAQAALSLRLEKAAAERRDSGERTAIQEDRRLSQADLAGSEADNRRLRTELARLEQERQRLEADVTHLAGEDRRLQAELTRAETDNGRLRAELARLEARSVASPAIDSPEIDTESLRQEAYESGFAEGSQAGREAGRETGMQDGLQVGRMEGRNAALFWISTAIRYLSGGSVPNAEEVREELVTQWLEDTELRGILIQTQRLSSEGIPNNRDTLPQLSLIGVVAAVQGDRARVETITERPIPIGERVEIRSGGDTPPGDLKATATVVARVGTLVQLEIVGEPVRPLDRDDLVYSIVLP